MVRMYVSESGPTREIRGQMIYDSLYAESWQNVTKGHIYTSGYILPYVYNIISNFFMTVPWRFIAAFFFILAVDPRAFLFFCPSIFHSFCCRQMCTERGASLPLFHFYCVVWLSKYVGSFCFLDIDHVPYMFSRLLFTWMWIELQV